MNYTQMAGCLNELLCISGFIKLGYECSIPYGNGAKYDFIVDVDGELLRIQCKTATQVKNRALNSISEYDDAIQINLTTSTTNTKEVKKYTYNNKQIDYFAIFYNEQVYTIPIAEVEGKQTITLRFSPPSNGQTNYHKADDYKIEKFFSKSKNFIDNKNIGIPTEQKEELLCKECGSRITRKSSSGLCPNCYSKAQRRVDRPERIILKEEIKNSSFLQLGKKYGVTDNAIRRWCKAYNLPSTKREINSYSDEEWEKI